MTLASGSATRYVTGMTKTSGQIAFEAYNAAKGGVTYDGKPIPSWDSLTDAAGIAVREAWEESARVIENALIVELQHDPMGLIRRAHGSVTAFIGNSRERSMVLTKLDEAALWFGVLPVESPAPQKS